MDPMNIWPILTASVAAFGIGALWYSPILFGKEWMSLMKISDSDVAKAKASSMWLLYGIHIIFTIVSFAVLGFLVVASGSRSGGDGAFIGFLVWLGAMLPIGVSQLLWEKRPFKLVAINMVNLLIAYMIGGAIVGAWR